MFLGPFCLAMHKGKEFCGGGLSVLFLSYFTQRNTVVLSELSWYKCLQSQADTAVWNTSVSCKIVALDLVWEIWNISLIFHSYMVANCGVRMVSMSCSLETVLSNTVNLKATLVYCRAAWK